jgi:hypothetical protein
MLDDLFDTVHAKRVESLANGAVGAMVAPRTAIHAIGAAYAAVAEILPKSAIKQVDRLLSNNGINVEELTPGWARFLLGPRTEVILAMDWTDFDGDDHTTLAVYVVTTHGRATPLAWKTVKKSSLGDGERTRHEHAMIDRLAMAIPAEISITLLADRGFGDQKLYQTLSLLGWDYVIRFRGCILVEVDGQTRTAAEWLPSSGRATKLVGARVTADRTEIGAVVLVHDKRMKEAWCLATSFRSKTAAAIVKLYGRRFTIEETFRDQKDLRFGMGLQATHIRSATRRDRLLMLLAIAQTLLTLLGAASERAGMDKYLKANTVKRRTHSLYRQGSYWYFCIPFMKADWLNNLMNAYAEVLHEHTEMAQILSVI